MATAEAAPIHPAFGHEGAWTEDAYLALPADRRMELVDGSLLVGPTTDDEHGRILVPDLVISARPAPDAPRDESAVRDSSVALVVIDVVGRGNGVADRWFKPQLYAGSRIPYALLVDHDAPFAVGNMLIGGRYHEYATAEGAGVLSLEEPFALELDLAVLGPEESPADTEPADTEPEPSDPVTR